MMDCNGLVIVHTGEGKGKTTAALGLALRAWGQGLRVLIIQFIKGGWVYGELKAAQQLGERFTIRPMGEGFVNRAGSNKEKEHALAALDALAAAQAAIASNQWDMIILDEINYAVKFGLIPASECLALISLKKDKQHLVFTGRDACQELMDCAQLVTEMKVVKHHYQQGIKAQKGIEF